MLLALVFLLGCSDLGDPELLLPQIEVETSTVNFSTVTIDASQTSEFYIANLGEGDLSGELTLTQDSSAFSLIPAGQFTLVSGDTLMIEVGFIPTSESSYSAQVHIISDDPNQSEITVAVSGTGTLVAVPALSLSTSQINFGSILSNTTAQKTFTISNTGTATLIVSSLTIDLSDYQSDISVPLTLVPGASQLVTVTFQPITAGTFNAIATIVSNGTSSPDQITLLGSAEDPVSYTASVQPVWNASCTGCHGSSAGLNLSSYAQMMNGSNSGAVVVTGDGANSKIIKKMRGESGSRMPLNGSPIDAGTIAVIETWIDQGALDN